VNSRALDFDEDDDPDDGFEDEDDDDLGGISVGTGGVGGEMRRGARP
jgi:hypothetical protein